MELRLLLPHASKPSLSKNLAARTLSTTPIQARLVTSIEARKYNRRRATLRISRKAALECALFIASSLKVIPEPVSLMLKEGISGGGNGNGVWNGFGGDGFFDGWRKRRKKLGIWGLVMLVATIVGLIFGKDFVGELLVLLLGRGGGAKAKGWVLGFCSCGWLILVLGLIKRHHFQKWGHPRRRGSIGSSLVNLFNKKRRTTWRLV